MFCSPLFSVCLQCASAWIGQIHANNKERQCTQTMIVLCIIKGVISPNCRVCSFVSSCDKGNSIDGLHCYVNSKKYPTTKNPAYSFRLNAILTWTTHFRLLNLPPLCCQSTANLQAAFNLNIISVLFSRLRCCNQVDAISLFTELLQRTYHLKQNCLWQI